MKFLKVNEITRSGTPLNPILIGIDQILYITPLIGERIGSSIVLGLEVRVDVKERFEDIEKSLDSMHLT